MDACIFALISSNDRGTFGVFGVRDLSFLESGVFDLDAGVDGLESFPFC